MAKKKTKKQLEFERRSNAAKKAWRTRRANDKKRTATAKRELRLQKVIEKLNLPKPKGKKAKAKADDKSRKLSKQVKKLRALLKHERWAAEIQKGLTSDMKRQTEHAINRLVDARHDAERQLRAHLDQEEFFKDFVPVEEMKWIRRDGTLALHMSSIRHMDDAEDIWAHLDKFIKSPNEFRKAAEDYADEFDIEVGEVYDFYYSP